MTRVLHCALCHIPVLFHAAASGLASHGTGGGITLVLLARRAINTLLG